MSFETMVKIRGDVALLARLYACIYDRAWRILDGDVPTPPGVDPAYIEALSQGPEASAHLLRPYITGLSRNVDVVAAYGADPASVTDAQILAVVRAVFVRVAPQAPAGP